MFALAAKLFAAYLLPVLAVLAPYEVWVTPKSGAPKVYSASESKETADAVARVLTKSGIPAEVRERTPAPAADAATTAADAATTDVSRKASSTTTPKNGFSQWADISKAIKLVPATVETVTDASGDTQHVKIVNFNKTVYTGPLDVKATLDRIRADQKNSGKDDGIVFTNKEGRLPKEPAGYYHEFVHWPYAASAKPYGMTFPGPMRVILGKNGEVYFTGDHYDSFYKVK